MNNEFLWLPYIMLILNFWLFQENTTKRYLQVPHSALNRPPFDAGNGSYACGHKLRSSEHVLRWLCVHIHLCPLLCTGGCDVDGSRGTAHVSESGNHFCPYYHQVHRHSLSGLLV